MAGTSADKMALLRATKADLKAALIEGGQEPGDKFSDYPSLVREKTIVDDSIITRKISGEYRNNRVTKVGYYAFDECLLLTAVSFPLVTSIQNGSFYGCEMLATIDFPQAIYVEGYAFHGCKALTTADFPAATYIGSNTFYNCSSLSALILRSEAIGKLSNTNAFKGTLIASGTGYIYVPRALVNSYKAATNWSTYAAQFRALEDYTVDGTTTGELDETKIAA